MIKLNMNTHKIDKTQYEMQTVDHRTPLRKPMSVVQYWVNTGQLFPTENLENNIHSDSGSSLAEEECIESLHTLNLPCRIINSSLNKCSENNLIPDKNLDNNSCSSSVDTAAYILANNNTTKKSDTIAIVEGSKVINKTQSCNSHISQVLNNVNDDNTKLKDASKSLKKIINKHLRPNEESNFKLIVNSDSDESSDKSKKNIDLHENKITSQKLKCNETHNNQSNCSETDESILEKTVKTDFQRKKLYNSTESPVEFTPVSEDNFSHRRLRKSFKKKYEHPALETPVRSKPLSLIIKRRLKRKHPNQQSSSFLVMSKVIKNDEDKNEVSETINDKTESQNESQKEFKNESLEKNCYNLKDNINNSDTETIKLSSNNEKSKKHETSTSDIETVKLKRSPNKFYALNNNKVNSGKFKLEANYNDKLIETELNKTLEKHSRNYKTITEFINNENKNKNIETCSKDKAEHFPTGTLDLIQAEIENLNVEKSSIEKLKNDKDKTNLMKSMKYTVVFSSSDESELNLKLEKNSRKKLSRPYSYKTSSSINKNNSKKLSNSVNDNQSKSEIKNTISLQFDDQKKIEKTSISTTTDNDISNNASKNDLSPRNTDPKNNNEINNELLISKKSNKQLLIFSSDDDTSSESSDKLLITKHSVSPNNISKETIQFNENKINEISAKNNHVEKQIDYFINKESKNHQTLIRNGHRDKKTEKSVEKLPEKLVESNSNKNIFSQIFVDTSCSSEDNSHQSYNTKNYSSNEESNKNEYNSVKLLSKDENLKSPIKTVTEENLDDNNAISTISFNKQKLIHQSCDAMSNEKEKQQLLGRNMSPQKIVSNENAQIKSNANNQMECSKKKEINELNDEQSSNEDLVTATNETEKFTTLREKIKRIRMKLNSTCSRIKNLDNNHHNRTSKNCEKQISVIQLVESSDEEIFTQSQNKTSPKIKTKKKFLQDKKSRLSKEYLQHTKPINKRTSYRYSQNKTKENKYLLSKSKRKSFNTSSDEDCIIPLKINSTNAINLLKIEDVTVDKKKSLCDASSDHYIKNNKQ